MIDNLLGNRDFCPMIRRTDRLNAAIKQQLGEEARNIVEGADPALLARAVRHEEGDVRVSVYPKLLF